MLRHTTFASAQRVHDCHSERDPEPLASACLEGGIYIGIISWIILGLIAGFIGSKIVDKQGQGFWLNIALGIVGALVGGFLFDLIGASPVTGLNIYHDCRNRGLGGGSADLQRGNRSPSSVMLTDGFARRLFS